MIPNDTPLEVLLTIDLALAQGYTPDEILAEDSPVRCAIRAAIAADGTSNA